MKFIGGLMAQAVSRSPPTAGVPSSRLGHSMWVSWWTKRGLGRFFTVSPVFPYHKFHSTIFSTPISSIFVSFHPPLWWCVRRGRPAPLLFTDLHYRGFIASHPSTRPCVGHELRIFIFIYLIVEYGDQSDIFRWKITNYLAILGLRKPLKTSTRLAGQGIWTRDLPNASLVRYHGTTSLGFLRGLFVVFY